MSGLGRVVSGSFGGVEARVVADLRVAEHDGEPFEYAGFGIAVASWFEQSTVDRTRVADGWRHAMIYADARGPDDPTAGAFRPPLSPLHPRPWQIFD